MERNQTAENSTIKRTVILSGLEVMEGTLTYCDNQRCLQCSLPSQCFERVHKNLGMFLGTSCPFMPVSEERMLRMVGKRLVKSP